MDSDLYDDNQSDSGVSADFSPCSTLENNTTTDPPKANETPIEKEIRRAIEREQSLRRSRGIRNSPTTPEFVEIPLRKSILSQSLPFKCERSQGKDRQFAGKKMQKEIQREAQREQVLVKLGKVPGIYDKGTVRELKERKLLFEAFQDPRDSCLTFIPRSKASANDISNLEKHKDVSSMTATQGNSFLERRWSADLLSQTHSAKEAEGPTFRSSRGPSLSEGTGYQVIILESNQGFPVQLPQTSQNSHSLMEVEEHTVIKSRSHDPFFAREEKYCGNATVEEEEREQEVDEEEIRPKENPFFKLRSSAALDKVEQDIREARERDRELRRQRSCVYGGAGVPKGEVSVNGLGRVGAEARPAGVERQSPIFPALLNRRATPELPGPPSRGGSGIPAVRQSLGKLGMWPPSQPEDKHVNQVEPPLSPRQKTPLRQCWESATEKKTTQRIEA